MMVEGLPALITKIYGPTAVVRFNRPAQRNPLSLALLQNLKSTTSALFARSDISSLIFTGTEDVFASGANINEVGQLDAETAVEFSRLGQDLFQAIADAKQLTIAAINGYCMGGALDLALACDIRIASQSAVFSHPGPRLGIITGWGGTQRLPQIIRRANSLHFMLTTRLFHASDALRVGLVTHVGDPVLSHAMRIAGQQKEGGK